MSTEGVAGVDLIVLYLDFDGVLHRDAVYRMPGRGITILGGQLFEWAHHLEDALEAYPGVRIVLSTSWVRELGFAKARSYLPSALAARVVGATFHRRIHGPTRELRAHWAESPRGLQIEEDARRRMPAAWFAIDDAVAEFTKDQSKRLVPCRSDLGLSEPAARADLRNMLAHLSMAVRRNPSVRGG